MTDKANQTRLLAAVRAAAPTPTRARSRGHGRTEERLIAPAPTFPGAAQVSRIVRYTGGLDGRRSTEEVVHCLTNLTPDQADPAALSSFPPRASSPRLRQPAHACL